MEASNTANFPFFNMCWSKASYKIFEFNSAEPFHSQVWPIENFSSQYQYNIKLIRDKNLAKYQLGDCQLIQIL